MAGLDTEVSIVNKALSRIGVRRQLTGDVDGTLASCTDTSVAKAQAELWMPFAVRELLESHPWRFARGYVRLVLVDTNFDEDADQLFPWGNEWRFAYALPDDIVRPRRFVADYGRLYYYGSWGSSWGSWASWPWPDDREWAFVLRDHEGSPVILTDVQEDRADFEYTIDKSDITAWTNSTALDGLVWRIARELALALKVDGELAQLADTAWRERRWAGMAFDGNDEIPKRPTGFADPFESSEWLSARGGR